MESLNEHLGAVGESIWSQTLGVSLTPCEAPDVAAATPMVQGQVQVTGLDGFEQRGHEGLSSQGGRGDLPAGRFIAP